MLGALKDGKSSPEDIAAATEMPLFRVRSGIRDLVAAGYAVEHDGASRSPSRVLRRCS
jgi:hypothetical protein